MTSIHSVMHSKLGHAYTHTHTPCKVPLQNGTQTWPLSSKVRTLHRTQMSWTASAMPTHTHHPHTQATHAHTSIYNSHWVAMLPLSQSVLSHVPIPTNRRFIKWDLPLSELVWHPAHRQHRTCAQLQVCTHNYTHIPIHTYVPSHLPLTHPLRVRVPQKHTTSTAARTHTHTLSANDFLSYPRLTVYHIHSVGVQYNVLPFLVVPYT